MYFYSDLKLQRYVERWLKVIEHFSLSADVVEISSDAIVQRAQKG